MANCGVLAQKKGRGYELLAPNNNKRKRVSEQHRLRCKLVSTKTRCLHEPYVGNDKKKIVHVPMEPILFLIRLLLLPKPE